jgi:glycosyltransferase involved in cell wall biosynthesis
MYLLPIPVPIFLDGERRLVATDWKRALLLLRDSLGGRYGQLVVAAPWLPPDSEGGREQKLEALEPGEDIGFEAFYDARTRARGFWTRELRQVHAKFKGLLERARVVHTGATDLYRPMTELAFAMAVRRNIPTVFVQDTDVVVQARELAGGPRDRVHAELYGRAYEQVCRLCVARADLSLLKGKSLMSRYGTHARNAREFHDTSYDTSEMASEAEIERRLASLSEARPLRFVYCGRLISRKGVDDSVRIIEAARKRGANVTLEVIGNGPDEPALREQIARANLQDAITLAGPAPYGPGLLRRLATFDALLFTPPAEDTPRMIFDGYAAGLPLVATGILYVLERAEEEHATLVLPRGATLESADRLVAVDKDRGQLARLARAAFSAGRYHAADAWYRRRAEWTHEAVAQRTAQA